MYPSLPERFEWHMNDRRFLTWLIESLRIAYEETSSENVLTVLNRLLRVKAQGEALEQRARDHEIDQCYRLLKELPYSQVTWLLYYRDKDLE